MDFVRLERHHPAVNYWYDRLVATRKLPTRDARKKAYAKFQADVLADGERVKKPMHIMVAFFSRHQRSEMIGGMIVSLFTQTMDSALSPEDHETGDAQATALQPQLCELLARHKNISRSRLHDDLVPTILKKLPVDLYNAKPFVYKRTADGYLLYSMGDNGIDDGANNESMCVLAGRQLVEPNNVAATPAGP